MVTIWKLRDGYSRNEALDIRVGNMAVREILNPNYEKLVESLEKQAAQAIETQTDVNNEQIIPPEHDHTHNHRTLDRTRPSWRR
jgi:phage terminase large subunit GpA-like protein